MVVCTLIYDASTGSDTAASGSNAPTVAVTGTNADITTTTVTLNETVDFTAGSGVLDDNTDVLWIDTPAGDRHLYRITGFTGGVATCTALTVTPSAGTARTADSWAVGGIRQSFVNDGTNLDFEDMLAGWEFSLQDTADFAIPDLGTPISLPGVGDLTDGPIRIVAAAGDSPTITWTENAALFNTSANTKVHFEGITMANTTSSSAAARTIYVLSGGSVKITCIDCNFDAAQGIHVSTGSTHLHVENCDFTGAVAAGLGVVLSNGRCNFNIIGSRFHDNAGSGVSISPTSLCAGSIVGCVFDDNVTHGLDIDAGVTHCGVLVHNCVFYSNGGDGVSITGTISVIAGPYSIFNNIFTENGGHGIDASAGDADGGTMLIRADHNAFFSNTGGELRGLDQGANDVTLTGDPFTNATGGDFSLDNTAGEGADCRDAGFGRTS